MPHSGIFILIGANSVPLAYSFKRSKYREFYKNANCVHFPNISLTHHKSVRRTLFSEEPHRQHNAHNSNNKMKSTHIVIPVFRVL
jgi:hypothetical protein